MTGWSRWACAAYPCPPRVLTRLRARAAPQRIPQGAAAVRLHHIYEGKGRVRRRDRACASRFVLAPTSYLTPLARRPEIPPPRRDLPTPLAHRARGPRRPLHGRFPRHARLRTAVRRRVRSPAGTRLARRARAAHCGRRARAPRGGLPRSCGAVHRGQAGRGADGRRAGCAEQGPCVRRAHGQGSQDAESRRGEGPKWLRGRMHG